MSRLTKAKSVSRYCTQYSQGLWLPLIFFESVISVVSPSTASTMSGTDFCWNILQSLVSVANHRLGTTSTCHRVSTSSRPIQEKRLT